jgi:hypothetical protein
VRIDTLAPVATTARGAGGVWHNEPVKIQLVALDAPSQVASLSWALDGGPMRSARACRQSSPPIPSPRSLMPITSRSTVMTTALFWASQSLQPASVR